MTNEQLIKSEQLKQELIQVLKEKGWLKQDYTPEPFHEVFRNLQFWALGHALSWPEFYEKFPNKEFRDKYIVERYLYSQDLIAFDKTGKVKGLQGHDR